MIIIKNRKLLLALSLILITFLFTGCLPFSSPPTVEEALLASIEVKPSVIKIKAGNEGEITSITAHYNDGTSTNIDDLSACTYESDNKTSVTVANGVIKVLSSCTAATSAKITVSYKKNDVTKSDTVTVTVPSSGG